MYGWIWRRLPGGTAVRVILALALVALAVTLLLLVVFPWVEPRIPLGDVTVQSWTART